MDADAERAALQQVAALVQRPDQMEKLPELRKRADRKKAAVEAMLRTGVQSQLEGIRTAIAHLHTAAEDIAAIDTGISSIRTRLKPFPQLKEKMRELRDANARHGQYAAAMENLKHIFNINQNVSETRIALEQGKLLVAHKHIMDLELARDELLFEVHKTEKGNKEYEKNLLVTFFIKVDELVNDLGRNMWFILGRTLDVVQGGEDGNGPQQLVTCLRIVEREERIDKYYIERKNKGSDFMPPGRPREWHQKALQTIEKTVWSRVEGNQLEDRSQNKSWLARYLEVCRRVILDDLLIARAAVPCFPPEYQIYDRFVHMYHTSICQRIRNIASEKLEKSELVQLMSWVQLYGSEELLGNRKLHINAAGLLQDIPVLSRSTLNSLYDEFIEMTRKDMQQWLQKTLHAEKDDWYKNVRPEEDNFNYYYTSLPNIIFGMLRDSVTLAKEVSVEVIPSVINITIEEFFEFATKYKDAFTAYRNKCFEDRSKFPVFTSTMVAIINNLQMCIESTDKYMQQVRLSMESDDGSGSRRGPARQVIIDNIDRLNSKWSSAANVAISYLRDEILEDMTPHLAELFSRKWLVGCSACETICMTLHDYCNDYRHLRPAGRLPLLMDLQFRIIGEYFKAIDARRLTFSTYDERKSAGQRIEDDAKRLERVFFDSSATPDMTNEQFSFITSVLMAAGDVIKLRDKSLLSLEATTFGRKFPNVSVDLLSALLACREDVGRNDARQLAEEVLGHVQFHPKDKLFEEFFSSCQSESTWRPSIDVANVLSSFIRRDATNN